MSQPLQFLSGLESDSDQIVLIYLNIKFCYRFIWKVHVARLSVLMACSKIIILFFMKLHDTEKNLDYTRRVLQENTSLSKYPILQT